MSHQKHKSLSKTMIQPPQQSGRRWVCFISLLYSIVNVQYTLAHEPKSAFIGTATFPNHGPRKEDGISLVHLTCAIPYSAVDAADGETLESSLTRENYQDNLKNICCERFSLITQHACNPNRDSTWGSLCDGDMASSLYSRQQGSCLEHIAQIPLVSNNRFLTNEGDATEKVLPDWKPIYSLILSSPINIERKDTSEALQTKKCIGGWSQLVLDESSSLIHMQEQDKLSNVPSPFSIPILDESLNHNERNNLDTFRASVDSELSSTGGMHRTLNLNVSLSYAEEGTVDRTSGSLLRGNLILYAFLPEGVFLDVDDPFEEGENSSSSCQSSTLLSCHVELVTALHTVIDIEQPAFVSPQHVVALQVTLKGEIHSTNPMLAESFTIGTKIHLRYPRLVSNNETHVPVTIPAPFVYSGTLEIDDEQKILELDTALPSCLTPITVHVAAGNEDDYIFVSLTTVFLSILGSWIMLREISRVSTWN